MTKSAAVAMVALAGCSICFAACCELIGGESGFPDSNPRHPDEAIAISWSKLAPENGKPFNDPFAKLSQDQLIDLSYVIQIRQMVSQQRIAPDGKDAQAAAVLGSQLKQQGVDIAWLMVQRERVRQLRALQVDRLAMSIADSLQNQKVSLTGYVIPIKIDDGRLTEFFLVPTIAACSHEDPPPRLQVAFVSSTVGVIPPGKRTPIRVTGKITAKSTTRRTYNANGKVEVYSSYSFVSPQIEVSEDNEIASRAPIP